MASYIHGNLAARVERKEAVRETKRVVVRTKTIPIQEKLLYLFTVALCVIVAGVIVWRYAQIYQMNTQIHNIQQQIRELQAENSILKEKIDKANDPEQLKKDAQTYGLVPRAESQTVRLTAGKGGETADKQVDSKLAMKK